MEPNYSILPLLNSLSVTRIDVVFTPTEHLEQKAWLGAAVRNRFLFACESIKLPDGTTLREAFDRCPLPETHFLYKQYCAGFPKAFVWDVSRVRPHLKTFRLDSGNEYKMELFLFGVARLWMEEIKTAIRQMMELGLGTPPVRLQLIDIAVHEPFLLESVASTYFANQYADTPFYLTISTRTPLSLMKNKQGTTEGYQKKMNGFPSIYQIVRSGISRFAALNILYAEDSNPWQQVVGNEEWNALIDNMSETAANAWLCNANIKQVSLYSTPKQNSSTVYNFMGYIGELTFSCVDPMLVPVMKMMGLIGIGNDVSFGLGFYNVETHKPNYGNSNNKSNIKKQE